MDSEKRAQGFWRTHRWLKWALGITAGFFAILLAAGLILARRAEPLMRAQIVQALEDHFHAHVELDSFHVTVRNGLWADGRGLRVWQPIETTGKIQSDDQEPPAIGDPLIRIQEFHFHTPLKYDAGKPIHIALVQLRGLIVDVPPRHKSKIVAPPRNRAKNLHEIQPEANNATQLPPASPRGLGFVVDRLDCRDAHLTLETDKPGKVPMVFDIERLQLMNIQRDNPVGYIAELTNPRPTGVIHTRGNIGPWNVPVPSDTPVDGDYHFQDADLNDFKGIGGILTSDGHFQGTLSNIVVDGQTSTPEFELDAFGTKMPLYTRFHALVDGTTGDTQLDSVDALLDHSHFSVRGEVIRNIVQESGGLLDAKGHNIEISMNVVHGRAEDFMRLVAKSGTPFFTGIMNMQGKLCIPYGEEPVQDRMKLNGTFSLSDVHFTSDRVQTRITELSLRGQGHPKEVRTADTDAVRSDMKGEFHMVNGVISLSRMQYSVPGADIYLKGTYGVDDGAVAFRGTARMVATVSQMVGGWKGFLLKPVDRFFKKNGAGTQIPVHISGTRDNPDFGIGMGETQATHPQNPPIEQ